MKKYYICFFILAALLAAAVLTGAYFYMYRPEQEGPIPNGVIESESYVEENLALQENRLHPAGLSEESDETYSSQAQMAAGPADAARAEPGEASGRTAGGEIPDGEKRYCLVAEDGFLLVFAKDRDAVCLDTHMPLSEFPEKEQERLMDGIWFSTMIEIFNYLESYSS